MSDPVQEWCDDITEKEDAGKLLYKEAPWGFLRLRTGKHAGRTVLKMHKNPEVDGEPITYFVPSMTWVRISEIEDCVCIRVFVSLCRR